MKTRLNLIIDSDLLVTIKSIANKNQTSVSELVEDYFKMIAKPAKCKNIIDLVESLPTPKIDIEEDLIDLFYQTQSKKYGF